MREVKINLLDNIEELEKLSSGDLVDVGCIHGRDGAHVVYKNEDSTELVGPLYDGVEGIQIIPVNNRLWVGPNGTVYAFADVRKSRIGKFGSGHDERRKALEEAGLWQ
jgi:hypothetical protein